MDAKLADLLEKKQKHAGAVTEIDWDQRRGAYIAAVELLYKQIETMLAGKVQTHRRPKQLTENYIGTYSIDDLIMLIGDEQVRFSPAGRNIAGAVGRVDVIGERGEATLIAQLGPRWSFVQTRQPILRTVPLDETTLAEVLQLVMRE